MGEVIVAVMATWFYSAETDQPIVLCGRLKHSSRFEFVRRVLGGPESLGIRNVPIRSDMPLDLLRLTSHE